MNRPPYFHVSFRCCLRDEIVHEMEQHIRMGPSQTVIPIVRLKHAPYRLSAFNFFFGRDVLLG